MGKKSTLNLSAGENFGRTLDDCLNCFGGFDPKDMFCFNSCALSINCAVAKNKFLNFQAMEDYFFAASCYSRDERE
jgi:hypothetical protein